MEGREGNTTIWVLIRIKAKVVRNVDIASFKNSPGHPIFCGNMRYLDVGIQVNLIAGRRERRRVRFWSMLFYSRVF